MINDAYILSNVKRESIEEFDRTKLFVFEYRSLNSFGYATGYYSKCFIKNKPMIVLKGSKIIDIENKSFQLHKQDKITYDELCKNKIVVDNVFHKDVVFTSASAAARLLGGTSLNGMKVWRCEDRALLNYIK